MPFSIVREDITRMAVDAIVNAANTELQMGGGVCGAIFKAAGAEQMRAACDPLAPIETGQAVITPGFALPAKHVIHAAGPVYRANDPEGSERRLRAAYRHSLELAAEHGLESIAFPLISSGIYGYPKPAALQVATTEIRRFLRNYAGDMDVYLAVFNREAFAASEDLLSEVASYIDQHYVDQHHTRRGPLLHVERDALSQARPPEAYADIKVARDLRPRVLKPGIADRLQHLDEPFSTTVMRLIDAKGMSDVEVYKRANLDRKLFSRIRTSEGYVPSKRTAVALALALELDLEQTRDLLQRAGFALSHSQMFDVIIEYFINHRRYDIFEINEVLFQYDQPLLGGRGDGG